MLYHLFPINSSTSWASQSRPEQCSEKISSWLYDHDSLTQKLENLCQEFHVQVIQQQTINATSPLLSGYFANETKVLVREVFLCCDGVPVVFAQTEIPLSTLTAEQAQLAAIGSESLGKILFQNPSMKRGPIEVAQFTDKSQLPALSPLLTKNNIAPLWARRSLFYLDNKPLLVSELFLPALGIYS